MDMTYGGRVRPEEPTVSGRGGAMVPPPRGAPPVPVLPPPPPRESGVSAGTSYPHYPPRQAAHAGELGDVDAAGQRVRGGRAVSRERPQRGAAARPSATATDAREAAVERAMALLRQDALQQRYLLHAGGPPEGGQWESMILARGAPAAAFTQQEGLAVGNVSPGRHRPAAVAGQQRAPSAGRQRSNKGVQQQLQQHRPAGQGVSDTSGGFPFQRPVTHAQQQLYVAGLQAHRAAGPAVEAHIPEPPAPPPIPATAAEREAAAAAQRVAGRAALQLAAVEGRRAEGLGGPPAMTQGPLGVPVARARRRLEMGGPGGPSVVGLSPREAALARAAAYMGRRAGGGGGLVVGGTELVAGAGAYDAAAAAGREAAAAAAVVRPSVAVQAAPEQAPRNPKVMTAPAGRLMMGAAGGGGGSRPGTSTSGAPSTTTATSLSSRSTSTTNRPRGGAAAVRPPGRTGR